MIGVYCYYKDDRPAYVGCSIDLKRRKIQHKERFGEYDYKVLEETTTELLFERERYWIRKLNTFQYGENRVIHNNMDLPEVRRQNSERMKVNNPMKGRTNRGSFVKGQKPIITEERNEKIRQSKLGVKNPMYGNKNAANHLNSRLTKCPKCGIITTPGNIARWHGDNCRR